MVGLAQEVKKKQVQAKTRHAKRPGRGGLRCLAGAGRRTQLVAECGFDCGGHGDNRTRAGQQGRVGCYGPGIGGGLGSRVGPKKMAALISLVGPGSRDARREAFSTAGGKLAVLREHGPGLG